MIDSVTITEIAGRAARTHMPDASLERVVAHPTTDSEGKAALSITLVLEPESVRRLTGDNVIDLLVELQQQLWNAGEERLPIVEYATEQEMQEAILNEDDA